MKSLGGQKMCLDFGPWTLDPRFRRTMVVELINTGSELMLGRLLNTHQQWLCRRLADLGYTLSRYDAIADDATEIIQTLPEALGRADHNLKTVSRGPTTDDITQELHPHLAGTN